MGRLTLGEIRFLTHSVLVGDLEAWARTTGVPVVDVMAALDPMRDVLVSWVHLSPRGNRVIAEQLGQEIARQLSARKSGREP